MPDGPFAVGTLLREADGGAPAGSSRGVLFEGLGAAIPAGPEVRVAGPSGRWGARRLGRGGLSDGSPRPGAGLGRQPCRRAAGACSPGSLLWARAASGLRFPQGQGVTAKAKRRPRSRLRSRHHAPGSTPRREPVRRASAIPFRPAGRRSAPCASGTGAGRSKKARQREPSPPEGWRSSGSAAWSFRSPADSSRTLNLAVGSAPANPLTVTLSP